VNTNRSLLAIAFLLWFLHAARVVAHLLSRPEVFAPLRGWPRAGR
jgi:hypothetical protein